MSALDNLTIGEAKQLAAMFGGAKSASSSLNAMVGKKCIIRTDRAGVFFGEIVEKDGAEVIVKNARRLWYWKAAEGISLSAVAENGIDQKSSKLAPVVSAIWFEAIELIIASDEAIKSIEGAKDAKTE